MKKAICSLALALSLCMSLGVSASAASYVADDINYQNLNGQQQAIMVYTAGETPCQLRPKRSRLHRRAPNAIGKSKRELSSGPRVPLSRMCLE